MIEALKFIALWTLASIPCGLLLARCIPRDPSNQSTRESEPTGFLGVGGAADFDAFHSTDLAPEAQDNHAA